jgi:hypothetical protein
MRLLVHCCAVLLLQLGMLFVAFAQVGQSLGWRTFEIPEYGHPDRLSRGHIRPGRGTGQRCRQEIREQRRSVRSVHLLRG